MLTLEEENELAQLESELATPAAGWTDADEAELQSLETEFAAAVPAPVQPANPAQVAAPEAGQPIVEVAQPQAAPVVGHVEFSQPRPQTTAESFGVPLATEAMPRDTGEVSGIGTTLSAAPSPIPNTLRELRTERTVQEIEKSQQKRELETGTGSAANPFLAAGATFASTVQNQVAGAARMIEETPDYQLAANAINNPLMLGALVAKKLGGTQKLAEFYGEAARLQDQVFGVNPAREEEAATQIGRGLGAGTAMLAEAAIPVAGPVIALAGAATGAFEQAFTSELDALREQGIPEMDAREQARHKANIEAIRTVPEMALYIGANALTAGMVGGILKSASNTTKLLAATAGGALSDTVTSGLIRTSRGQDILPSWQDLAMDIGFAPAGARYALRPERAAREVESAGGIETAQAVRETLDTTPPIPRQETPREEGRTIPVEPVEQAPVGEALRPASETPAAPAPARVAEPEPIPAPISAPAVTAPKTTPSVETAKPAALETPLPGKSEGPGAAEAAVAEVRAARPAFGNEREGDVLGITSGSTRGVEAAASAVRDIFQRFFFGEYGRIKSASGETAMRAKLQGDIDMGLAAAAIRKTRTELLSQIKVKKPWYLPKTWVPEYRKFVGELLPAARYLNPTGKTAAGEFIFEPFEMRAGTVEGKLSKSLSPGSIVPTKSRSGIVENLRVGEILSDGRAQLVRGVGVAEQQAVLADMQARHPQNAWLLEKFIDPDLAGARVEHSGIELADFNRAALAEMYELDAPLAGYTPDVMLQRGVIGGVLNWLKTSSLPGTKYKTGAAAESGRVQDLFTGFFTRQAELAKRNITAKASADLLAAAATPHKRGAEIPAGHVEFKTGIEGLINKIAQTHGKLAADLGIEGKTLIGVARKFEGKSYTIREATLDVLVHQLAIRKMDNVIVKAGHRVVTQFNKGLLARPMSAILNQMTNEIFIGLDAARNGVTSMVAALVGNKALALKSAEVAMREIKGAVTDRWYNREYRRSMDEILPPELFENQNLVAAISGQERTITGLADVALKVMRYSEIDAFGKQRLGAAHIRTYAREAGQAAVDSGLIADTPAARKAFAVDWMQGAPDRVRQDIMLTTNLMIGNYADAPMWLKSFNRIPLAGPAIAPFINFKYQLFRQQATLATGALREVVRSSDPSATTWWSEKRIRAVADLLTVTSTVGGVAWWLSLDDEKGRKIGTAKAADGTPLKPEEMTANRIRANIIARWLGLNTTKDDWWLYTRNFPYLNEAAMIAAWKRDGTFDSENFFGDLVSQGVAWKAADALMGKVTKYSKYESSSAQLGKISAEFIVGSIVPLPWVQMAREISDPFKRQTTGTKTRPLPMSNFIAGGKNVIPGDSKDLPLKLDKKGKPMKMPGSPAVVKFVSPINIKPVSTTPEPMRTRGPKIPVRSGL